MPLEQEDIAHFMNEARIELTGASDIGIKTALYTVLDEFFQDSLSWRETLSINVSVGVQSYKLLPKEGGRIFIFMGALDGWRLPVAAFMPHLGEMHVRYPVQVSSIPVATTNPPSPVVRSATTPWLAFVAETVKKPVTKDEYPVAPAWVLQIYFREILDGVLGKMMAQPAKSYTNQTTSGYHLRRFRQGIQIARTAANRENSYGAQNWAFPRGWGYANQRGGMVAAWPWPYGR